MHILQKLFATILNFFFKFTNRIDEKIRNMMISLSCSGLIVFFVFYFTTSYKKLLKNALTFDSMICSIFLLAIIIFSIKEELQPVKWNKVIFYTFFAAGAGVVAISFLHPIGSGYRAWGTLMMFGFPCLYYVWNNRGDYDALYKRLSASTLIVGISYYCYCFYLACQGKIVIVSDRVNGTFYDANMFSMIGMIMVGCSLYMLLVNRHSKIWFVLTILGFGVGISITMLGESRLAILSDFGSVVAFSIFYLKIRKTLKENKARRFLRAELLLLSMVLFLVAGNAMTSINQEAQRRLEDTSIASVNVEDALHEPTTYETRSTQKGGYTGGDVFDRFNIDGQDINTYTAGRYQIWKNYAQFLNSTGNDFSKADWFALTYNTVKHAHNNFLEIGYRCGIPVAILHTFLELCAGIICLIYLFNRNYYKPYYLFAIVFMITYTIQSLFDIATIPFERPAPFFFYMIMVIIFSFKTTIVENPEK